MRLLPFAIGLLFPGALFCQTQGNIWYFGNHAGLDFSSGDPVEITDGQTHFVDCPTCHAEGSAVLCDSTGALLFYSDGARAWNAQHMVMPNGNGLMSNASATQSALILPKPGSNELFYLFTVDDFHLNSLQNGFRYSVVDMCRDAGLGDIIADQKNILVVESVAEKLAAVRHANGTDYWVIVHKWQSDAFYVYPLTSSGLGAPVVSHVGSMHPTGMGGMASSLGQMKMSPNGEKLVIANGNSSPSILEYFDFDTSTGVVSNAVALDHPNWMYYGVSFSPDNSKLYAAVTMNGNGIYQFDLNAGDGDPVAVQASMTQVAFTYNYLGLQLAVNGKIYVARSPFAGNAAIGVIHAPNNPGLACNYQDSAIVFTGSLASYSFPSFVDSYDYSNGPAVCTTGFAEAAANLPGPIVNPVADLLFLSLPGSASARVEIFDAAGRRVRSLPFAPAYRGTDVRTLVPGLYVAIVECDGRHFATRFIKE